MKYTSFEIGKQLEKLGLGNYGIKMDDGTISRIQREFKINLSEGDFNGSTDRSQLIDYIQKKTWKREVTESVRACSIFIIEDSDVTPDAEYGKGCGISRDGQGCVLKELEKRFGIRIPDSEKPECVPLNGGENPGKVESTYRYLERIQTHSKPAGVEG
ncbi:MAG: hypothetical protein JW754_05825 [Candidatus Aenigmarchaeota archaeon]|nr:hypothetical protein [Candidatus Aenigmarchaeota archaeon]